MFGGKEGIRDGGLLESALARPQNKWSYGGTALPALASAYGFGLSRDHPFIDGNKRTAFTAMLMFLGLNDLELKPAKADATAAILALAAGEIGEDMLARWSADDIAA